MAVAFDSSTTNHTAASTTATYAFNNVGGNAAIVAFTANKAVVPPISGVTYAGNAMTASPFSPQSLPTDLTVKVYLYSLLSAPTGSNNVVITFTLAPDEINSHALSYSGVGSIALDTNTNGTSNSGTLSATTTIDNSLLVGIFRNDSDGNGTAGTSTTRRSSITGQSGFYEASSLRTPPGAVSIISTFGSADYGGIGFVLAPPFVAAAGGATLAMMGVG